MMMDVSQSKEKSFNQPQSFHRLANSNDKSHLLKFKFERKIGEGSSGLIVLATDLTTGQKCCCKIIPKSIVNFKVDESPSTEKFPSFEIENIPMYEQVSQDDSESGQQNLNEHIRNHSNSRKNCAKSCEENNETAIDVRHLVGEVDALQRLNHPNIPYFIDFIEDEVNFYIFQEYCDGVTLLEFINNRLETDETPSEEEMKTIMRQILQTLAYLHSNNIAHRDLKLENIIVINHQNINFYEKSHNTNYSIFSSIGNFNDIPNDLTFNDHIPFNYYSRRKSFASHLKIKIVDFGLSSNSGNETLLSTFCGSINYTAPEIIKQNPYVGYKADIWSAGVIMYALLIGQLPFYDDNMSTLIFKIVAADFELPSSISDEAQELLRSMMESDPKLRVTACEALSNSYLFPVQEQSHEMFKSLPTMPAMPLETKTKILSITNGPKRNTNQQLLGLGSRGENRTAVIRYKCPKLAGPARLANPKKAIVRPLLPTKFC
ncbi:hypothetical protein TRFO_02052 [Tritrichomonas foetus]|uniref:Protein kinase domain-containing protein n=1 Tax=Tritrichomonas foetus TaxID=1144522 RepID=A0A1J4JCU8_9EUKA|nr:hypothetical protein TRFO_02052 [Tritrichomonas foetus]|eukprot:OHS96928.1 hypothetical protein TRFO_02052 [Tritrichomonas foetus]